MQKKAMRIVCNVGYYVHTNYLFLKLQTLKFKDIVDLKTTQIMYKAKNKVLPNNIQKWFKERDSRYNLRRRGNLSQSMARTTLKSMCISVNGVRLWNNLPVTIKESKHIVQFKRRFKMSILEKYIN